MNRKPLSFGRFVIAPENRAARLAVDGMAAALGQGGRCCEPNPLYLFGPSGTGKSHLVSSLVDDVVRRLPRAVVALHSASAWRESDFSRAGDAAAKKTHPLAEADLLVVEDVQHLPRKAEEGFIDLIDERLRHGGAVVVTAHVGPPHLARDKERFSARLTSRLASGLVVGLEPLGTATRRAVLQDKAHGRQLALAPDVLDWLADHLPGSGRQLEGAVTQMETLARLQRRPLTRADVSAHFRDQVEAARVTLERVAQRVGGYFGIEPRHLQSRRRSQNIVLPRQVGMYLARRLTTLSLGQIGAFFGGRDHSTVLHAWRKIEHTLEHNPALSSAVRQLQADLA